MARRRYTNPFKNETELTALAVSVRHRAYDIDALADLLLANGVNDRDEAVAYKIKEKALGIIDLIEEAE